MSVKCRVNFVENKENVSILKMSLLKYFLCDLLQIEQEILKQMYLMRYALKGM